MLSQQLIMGEIISDIKKSLQIFQFIFEIATFN